MTPGDRLADIARENRRECEQITGEAGELDEAEDFSPAAYNRISAPILSSLFDVIERLTSRWPASENLGLATYTDIHHRLCRHYFQAYESLRGLENPRAGTGEPPPSDGRSLASRIRGVGRHTLRVLWRITDALRAESRTRVVYSGSTTMSRFGVRRRLRARGVRVTTPGNKPTRGIKDHGEQVEFLHERLESLHRDLADMMDVAPGNLPSPPSGVLNDAVDPWKSAPSLPDDAGLLFTGPLSNFVSRSLALDASRRDIPIITVHHGAHHLIFDEPYYPLYEGALPDHKLVYGAPEIQRDEGTAGPETNLRGEKIGLMARTHPMVRRMRSEEKIGSAAPLEGKRIVYFSSNFQRTRYGPYRDVHPIVYLRCKRILLNWLEAQTGRTPAVRPHPKRETTAYDPRGYPTLEGDLTEAMSEADVFALDYPTTVLGPTAATSKPILFFDLGLRRLHPSARERVQKRCHTAEIDIVNPETGLATMENDLDRKCFDAFTPVHAFGTDEPEVDTAVHYVREVLRSSSRRPT